MEKVEKILVSIQVLSYNSEDTIVETLDSIKNQTYQNLELIVSDDCSQDKTIEIAKVWIEENAWRFTNVNFLTIDHNTGIPANLNRALKASHGEWSKDIAADDILLPNCIEACVNFISSNKEINWVVGKSRVFRDIFNDTNLVEDSFLYPAEKIKVLSSNLETQRRSILKNNFIGGVAVFLRTQMLKDLGGYNEQYTLLEDWPMCKKILFAGHRCFFLDEYITGYRINDNSVSIGTNKLFNFRFKESEFLFYKNELFKYYSFSEKTNIKLHFYLCYFFHVLNINNLSHNNERMFDFLNKVIDHLFKNKNR